MFVDYDTNMTVALSRTRIDKITADFPSHLHVGGAYTDDSPVLSHLMRILGINSQATLMLKSVFPVWLSRLRTRAQDGTAAVRIGFYTAPSVRIYSELLNLNTIPSFVASGRHRIDTNFKAVCANLPAQVRPILVACLSSSGLVAGNEMLPLTHVE